LRQALCEGRESSAAETRLGRSCTTGDRTR